MRNIDVNVIKNAVAKLCIDSNYYLSHDVYECLKCSIKSEESPLGKEILQTLVDNADLAKKNDLPICQDTGMAVVFVELGQDVHISGGTLRDAVDEGVRIGYTDGYLRKSVVADPIFDRVNTKDNAPAILHLELVAGDKMKITVAPKGFGSENMGALKMCTPSEGVEGVINFVVETVKKAGPNPCPPIVVGVGVGGTMEIATYLSKKALIRPLASKNPAPKYAELEDILLEKINKTGVGPQGLGGTTTALAVNVEYHPTHIAGMPVSVNINCHATRHAEVEL